MRFFAVAALVASFASIGHTVPDPTVHIIGGKPVTEGEDPFAALIRINFGGTAGSQCTGSIISPTHIITAAHCVTGNSEVKDAHPQSITVHVGAVDVNDLLKNPQPVKRYFRHPGYLPVGEEGDFDEANKTYDIAVLELAKPLKFSETVQPVKLYPSLRYKANTVVTAAGWGKTSGSDKGQLASTLLKTQVTIASVSTCQQKAGQANFKDNGAQVCTVSSSGSTCSGDSGGPLYLTLPKGSEKDTTDSAKAQVGVVSFGKTFCPLNGGNFFVNPYFHAGFIHNVTGLDLTDFVYKAAGEKKALTTETTDTAETDASNANLANRLGGFSEPAAGGEEDDDVEDDE
ncbi:trypsin-like serine protease [Ramicandelaber brevisporus]|nr:trypsin-like serine protease [Ramicandelaber brevisporus]